MLRFYGWRHNKLFTFIYKRLSDTLMMPFVPTLISLGRNLILFATFYYFAFARIDRLNMIPIIVCVLFLQYLWGLISPPLTYLQYPRNSLAFLEPLEIKNTVQPEITVAMTSLSKENLFPHKRSFIFYKQSVVTRSQVYRIWRTISANGRTEEWRCIIVM